MKRPKALQKYRRKKTVLSDNNDEIDEPVETNEQVSDENISDEEQDSTDIKNDVEVKASDIKIGRKDPCICGSGKKYKKCCGSNA